MIKKILPRELTQKLIRLRTGKTDRLLCKSLLWATTRDARLLGMAKNSLDWGHCWIIKHLENMSLYDKILVDLGSGPSRLIIEFYKQRVRHAYQIDLLNTGLPSEGISVLQSDLEKPLPLPDSSIDIVVGTRFFEYLTVKGRLLQIKEIERILRPGGKAFLTMLYILNLDDHLLKVLSKDSKLIEQNCSISEQLNIASMLESSANFRFDDKLDLSLFPGFDGFSENRVLNIPGLITYSLRDLKYSKSVSDSDRLKIRCAEIGIVLEKPDLGRIGAQGVFYSSENSGISFKQKKTDTDEPIDPRLSYLHSAFPSIAGKKILYLYDDGDKFSGALEMAGATVHSCVPDMDSYNTVRERYPERKCWIHDLDHPWSLNLSQRYDVVLAFYVLDRLSDPRPFIEYVTQLAPVLLMDMPADIDDSEITKMIDPARLKDKIQLLDLDVYEFPREIFYKQDLGYFEEKTDSGNQVNKKRSARRLYLCNRQRDNLSPLIVHVHIPKAAGQAFEDFLSRNFQGRVTLYYPEKPAGAQWDLFKEEIQNELSPLVFSSQSMNMYFPPILGNRLALYVSFFRHPFSMIFSYIKYIKKNYEKLSAAHKAILPENLQSMSIEESVKWHIRNGGFFPLPVLELTKGLGVKRTKEIVDRFLFTGIVEEMDRSIKLLCIKLEPYGFHFENLTMPRKNTTQDVDLEGYDFNSDKEFQEFAGAELYEEVEFYEWVRERFEKESESYKI